MTDPAQDEPQVTLAECRRAVVCLEALVRDADLLAELPPDEWKRLIIAAGRLSRPAPEDKRRVTKAFRRFRKRSQLQNDREARSSAQIREARVAQPSASGVYVLPSSERPSEVPPRRLRKPRACYVCKAPFTELHFFYDSMCLGCAEHNYQKRTPQGSLAGRTALVTGARIKIGYHITLMLLRAGARVIATSRFPQDAVLRYSEERDFDVWKDRLALYGLDLRHCPSVEAFADHVASTSDRLDLLINNAAQTIQRPVQYYAALLDREREPLARLLPAQKALLAGHAGLVKSDAFSARALAPLAEVGSEHDAQAFPRGRFDDDGNQLDLRPMNSWRLRAEDVQTPELLEVHLVNAISPFILVSRLHALMLRTDNRDKHVVNVSAMEGCFSRNTKTEKHPHTNMAKASLNMLTRTSAADFAQKGIFMNSVDTGWVTDEDPHVHAMRKRHEDDFHPPLDAIDGAARVVDPIFTGYATGEHPFGKFFKDYFPSQW
ncbi:MAG TPA: SDR family oxidoreductase [Polyangiaceae bacterium]